MVVEVMGRSVGWLVASAGIAAGADAICLPEEDTDLDDLAGAIVRRHDSGATSSIVVVAEGAHFHEVMPATAHLGSDRLPGTISAGTFVANGLSSRTEYETRLTVLGHIQRGGTPTASDRLLATNLGATAVKAVWSKDFGTLVATDGETACLVPLSLVYASPRPLPASLLHVARSLTIQTSPV